MTEIYVDTSVLAAYYAPEPISAEAQRHLGGVSGAALGWLVRTEMASAMAKKRRRELSTSGVDRLLDRFDEHVSAGLYRLLPVDGKDYEVTYGWIRGEGLLARWTRFTWRSRRGSRCRS